jgi:spore maturation protein CgeB
MNILIVGRFYTESIASHISESIQEMGHTTIEFEVGLKRRVYNKKLFRYGNNILNAFYKDFQQVSLYRKQFSRKIHKKIKFNRIDLTLVCHDFLTPEDVNLIKQITKAPIAMWNPDHFASIGKMMFLNADYTHLFFEDPYIVKIFKNEYHKNAFYLPECFNPKYHKKMKLNDLEYKKYGCDITTAGNLHPSRVEIFKSISNFDIKIWGIPAPNWLDTTQIDKMVQNEFVANLEKSKAFCGAKIVLNTVHPANIGGLNCRAFEIAGTGRFQLINWRFGLNQLFEENTEIVAFRNLTELRERLNYYLQNDNERQKIADAGYERALKDHTYQKRMQLLLDTIFNGKNGYTMLDFNL